MQQITTKIKLIIFRVIDETLVVHTQGKELPSKIISPTVALDEQVSQLFFNNLFFSLENNYVEQLYTISDTKNEITIVYFILLPGNKEIVNNIEWINVNNKQIPDHKIISYAMQRLQWKIEYTNVVYSLLPQEFTLSDLQKTYEVILQKKLDKRNFRKKILSLKFLTPTKKKRIDKARPAQMYRFTKYSPLMIKVFS